MTIASAGIPIRYIQMVLASPSLNVSGERPILG